MNGNEQIPDMATGLDPREKLIYWLCMQGLGVVVLAFWLYTMYLDQGEMKIELRACNAENVRLLQKNGEESNLLLIDIRDLLRAQAASQSIPVTRNSKK